MTAIPPLVKQGELIKEHEWRWQQIGTCIFYFVQYIKHTMVHLTQAVYFLQINSFKTSIQIWSFLSNKCWSHLEQEIILNPNIWITLFLYEAPEVMHFLWLQGIILSENWIVNMHGFVDNTRQHFIQILSKCHNRLIHILIHLYMYINR